MAYTERFDLMVSNGTFTTKDGTEKTRWTKAGIVFKGDDGRMWGTMELIPVNWDGKFNLFKPQPKEDGQQQSAPQPQGQQWSQQPMIKDPDLPF